MTGDDTGCLLLMKQNPTQNIKTESIFFYNGWPSLNNIFDFEGILDK